MYVKYIYDKHFSFMILVGVSAYGSEWVLF